MPFVPNLEPFGFGAPGGCTCGLASGWIFDAACPLAFVDGGFCVLLGGGDSFPNSLTPVDFCWSCGDPLPKPASHARPPRQLPLDLSLRLDELVANGCTRTELEEALGAPLELVMTRDGQQGSAYLLFESPAGQVHIALDRGGRMASWSQPAGSAWEAGATADWWEFPSQTKRAMVCHCEQFDRLVRAQSVVYRDAHPFVGWRGAPRAAPVLFCPCCGGVRSDADESAASALA